jgi:hypothetical protein
MPNEVKRLAKSPPPNQPCFENESNTLLSREGNNSTYHTNTSTRKPPSHRVVFTGMNFAAQNVLFCGDEKTKRKF